LKVRYDMVVCYVVRPDESGTAHELLQLKRSAGRYMAGTWQAVSGKIERDEPAWQAALRELREETGLVPAEFYQLSHVEAFYIARIDTIWHRPSFAALVGRNTDVRLNEEHEEFRWIAWSSIDQQVMWPGERAALTEARRDILAGSIAKPHLRIDLPR
jgi:dihydroneopterin triphosphate diphosphatase